MAADAIASEMRDWLSHRITLFGHSLGALVAFEVARRAARHGWQPAALVVSGSRAPSEDLGRPCIAHLGHPEFGRRAVGLGLAPAEIVADPELADLFLGPLRADLALCERYPWGRTERVEIPMCVLGGEDDHLVPLSSARAWKNLTTQAALVMVIQGGHMFVSGAAREVVAAICAVARPPHETGSGQTGPGEEAS
jgi:surfactin synthase thioesterase subunit